MAVTITGEGAAEPFEPFTFTQSTPAGSWPIVHGLGHYPQVTVVDMDGSRVIPDIDYGDVNTVTITHGSPRAGKAYLI